MNSMRTRFILFSLLVFISIFSYSNLESAGPHDYFDSLISRSDFWKGYSLRPRVGAPISSPYWEQQMNYKDFGGYQRLTSSGNGGYAKLYTTYSPSTDTDPNRQDAAKVVIPAFVPIENAGKTLVNNIDATVEQFYLSGDSPAYNTANRTFLVDGEKMLSFDPDGSGPIPIFNRTTYLLNVRRGQHGTTATSHSAGTFVKLSTNTVPNVIELPLNTTDGNVYLFTWDGYWTDSYLNSGLTNHKTFNFLSNGIWLEPNTIFSGRSALTGNTFPGFSQSNSVATFGTRSYSQVGGDPDWTKTNGNRLGPNVTDESPLSPQLNDFVFKPNTWVRFWYLIDQRANDYDLVSAWIADENNNPVQVYNKLQISVRPSSNPPNTIEQFYLEYNTSTDDYVRGNDRDFIAYVRNFVALRNPPSDITSLLIRPGGGGAPPLVPDTTPPVVSITSPTNNSTVTGTTNINASATDDRAVSSIQFKLDGTVISTDTTSPYSYSWNTTTLTNGVHTLTALATDTSNHTTTSSSVTVTVNNTTVPVDTPPTISTPTIYFTSSSATISFTTNENTTSVVQYGLSTSYGLTKTSSDTISHTVTITDLTPNTIYNYRISATDTTSKNTLSTNRTFTTLALGITPPPPVIPPPVVPPVVVPPQPIIYTQGSITMTLVGNNPSYLDLGSSYIDPGIVITGSSDFLFKVLVSLNGVDVGTIHDINTRSLPVGTHSIKYKVTDSLGKIVEGERTIIITSSITPPPITPITVSLGASPTFDLYRVLYIGTNGNDVLQLQNILISKGYLAEGNNNGNFGPLTRSAVRLYQCDKLQICSGDENTTGWGTVGQRTKESLVGGVPSSLLVVPPPPSTQTTSNLSESQRSLIQKQINELLILVQQLLTKLKELRGF